MPPCLPIEYENFLATYGAFEGLTTGSVMPGYVVLWTLEAVPGNNSDLEIDEYAPGFIAFGGDGGGEVLAFDSDGAVFMLPLIGMEPQYAVKVADSFQDLAARFELSVR